MQYLKCWIKTLDTSIMNPSAHVLSVIGHMNIRWLKGMGSVTEYHRKNYRMILSTVINIFVTQVSSTDCRLNCVNRVIIK
jgi:hypothetical protein